MKRTLVLSITMIFFSVIFCGCTAELHERLPVQAIGVDFTDCTWQVTVLSFDVNENQKQQSYTAYGDTVAAALDKIESQTGKTPLYSHCSLLVFGRTCAERGLDNCLDFFIRHYDSKPNMKVYMADATAKDILLVSDEDEVDLSVLTGNENNHAAISSDLIDLINGTFGANHSAAIPIIQKKDRIEIIKTGIFRNLKLLTELNLEETQGIDFLNENNSINEIVFSTASCGTVSVSPRDCYCTVRFTGTKEMPVFEIEMYLTGEISSLEHGMQSLPSHLFTEIEIGLAETALNKIAHYLQNTVIRYGSDISGLGNVLLHEDPKLYSIAEPTFDAFLKESKFNIIVTANINRIEEEDTPYF